jgi:opacity protein-like surface antigen
MRSLKVALFAGAAFAAAVNAASAADLPPIMQPRAMAPVQVEEFGGWYLRGDIGAGMQSFKQFDHVQTNAAFVWPASWRIDQRDMGDTFFVGGGVGYQWNSWLRFDATAEYRAKTKFKVLGSYTEFCPGGRCFDLYDGNHSALVVMANAYVDLGTWWCLTPFVGVGAGFAQHRFSGLTDVGYISDGTSGFGYAQTDSSEWKFAWALHAGVAYNVNQNFKMELAYRYLNFGNVNTPIIDCASAGCATGGGPQAYYTMRDFSSHDFKLGMRWMLTPDVQPVYAPPLMRKG